MASLEGHTGWVLAVACRSDGKVLATSSSDGIIKLWDLANIGSAFTTLRDQCASSAIHVYAERLSMRLLFRNKEVWSLAWRPDPPTGAFAGVTSSVASGAFVRTDFCC